MGGRVRRGDNQAVLVLVIDDREIVALPVPVRACAVQTEDEGNFLIRFQIARVIEKVGAAGLHLNDGSLVDHPVGRAVLVRTAQDRCTGPASQLDGLWLSAGKRREYQPSGYQSVGHGRKLMPRSRRMVMPWLLKLPRGSTVLHNPSRAVAVPAFSCADWSAWDRESVPFLRSVPLDAESSR